MTNDAKLGLVVGVGLVILVAVVFFRKELAPAGGDLTVTTAGPRPRTVRAQSTRLESANATSLRHTVRAGDTLDSLAWQYYGDSERAHQIYQANRGQLASPAALPLPGTVLRIPEPVQTASARH